MSHVHRNRLLLLAAALACSKAAPALGPTAASTQVAADSVKTLIAALDTLQGEFREVGDLVFTFESNTRLLERIAAFNEAAVPQLVECVVNTKLARATAMQMGRVRVGVLCFWALVYTDYFEARNAVQGWPEGFIDSTLFEYNAKPAELRRARRAWRRYLKQETMGS